MKFHTSAGVLTAIPTVVNIQHLHDGGVQLRRRQGHHRTGHRVCPGYADFRRMYRPFVLLPPRHSGGLGFFSATKQL